MGKISEAISRFFRRMDKKQAETTPAFVDTEQEAFVRDGGAHPLPWPYKTPDTEFSKTVEAHPFPVEVGVAAKLGETPGEVQPWTFDASMIPTTKDAYPWDTVFPEPHLAQPFPIEDEKGAIGRNLATEAPGQLSDQPTNVPDWRGLYEEASANLLKAAEFQQEQARAIAHERERVQLLQQKINELAPAEQFMKEWPAMQADIARQCGADLNQGESLEFHKTIEHLKAALRTSEEARGIAVAALLDMQDRKDAAYEERNRVVAALATCYPATKWPTTIDGWNDEWHNCVYIQLPTGQVSWHYHDSQKDLFSHVPRRKTGWDGHSTETKYRRVRKFTRDYEPRK